MKRVELLAPAGDIECFRAAINAGADAVYLAGKSFGARASASNFTHEELISVLNQAHILGKKIYLTFNTLIKEREWGEIYDFLEPLYNNGLDGIIIQDLGLIDYLHAAFPSLELHASTQMTITSHHSVQCLKERGISRIVPARELSLEEIKNIKQLTGIEIETFIHGALCYSYSGQCLFSSFLGKRSGNRGRCAGPCRLPYVVSRDGKTVSADTVKYPLSLKDICTIDYIPQLIEAGIDSFKIEGRLKSAEYVANVTALYRKYIDKYYEGTDTKVSNADRRILENLYLRSEAECGYYFNHNGRNMITLMTPSYNTDRDKSIAVPEYESSDIIVRRHITAKCAAFVGSCLCIDMSYTDDECDEEITVSAISSETIQPAKNNPATVDDVIKRISKTGATLWTIDSVSVTMDDNCFIPVKVINELRRECIESLEREVLGKYLRDDSNKPLIDNDIRVTCDDELSFYVSIMKADVLDTVAEFNPSKIYIPYDLIMLNEVSDERITKIIDSGIKVSLCLPRVFRSTDEQYMSSLIDYVREHAGIDSVLCRSAEEIAYLHEHGTHVKIESDSNVYAYNRQSLAYLRECSDMSVAPLELSYHEINDIGDLSMCIPLYGCAPLMVSANCVAKTTNNCTGTYNAFEYSLTDRYKKTEPVFCNCLHCYNEIFNCVATSYHKRFGDFVKNGYKRFLINLTVEDAAEVRNVLEYYLRGDMSATPPFEFTTGHIDKGAI